MLERNWDEACALLRQAWNDFVRAGDDWGVALAVGYLGTALTFRPEHEEQASQVLGDARSRALALADPWLITVSSFYLGTIAMRHGDYAVARMLNEEMLACARDLGDAYRISRSLHQFAELELAEARPDEALGHLRASMAMSHEQRRTGDLAQQLRLLARIKAAQSRHEEAVRSYALAARLQASRSTMPPDDASEHERLRDALRATLGDRRYELEWASGLAMSPEDVLRM